MDEVGLGVVMDAVVTNAGRDQLAQGDKKRITGAIAMVTQRMRGAIQAAGRFPLAVTASTIPPEAVQHACVLAVQLVVGSQPTLIAAIVTPGGVYSPFDKMVGVAEKWITSVMEGGPVTYPTDPTGSDYATPADPALNPVPSGVRWGDSEGQDSDTGGTLDMTITG